MTDAQRDAQRHAQRRAERGDALAIAALLALGGLQGAWWILKWLGGTPWPGQGRTS